MDVRDLHLPEQSFSSAPTKTQIVNLLNDLHSFLNRVSGSLMMDGSYTAADQPMGILLNGSIQLKAAAAAFEAGPNAAGLAVPSPGPMPVQRR